VNRNLDLLAREARRLSGQTGGRWAFAELARAAGPVAYRIAGRVLGDEDLAKDAMQETLLKLADNLEQYDPARPFVPWLGRIAARAALDLKRRENVVATLPLSAGAEVEAGAATRPDEVVVAKTGRALLDRLVGELSVRQRAVFVLRDLEGFTTAEIAAQLETTASTVRVHLARARQLVRQRWLALHEPERNTDEM
jgi:RNA polymerase sigma-70 factor (ECF subfamily)